MSVRYLKLYVAVVALVVSASLAVVWITSGAVYSNYLFLFPVFGVIVSLAAIYNYRSRRVYLLDMMTGEYKFSHDDTVYTRGELHNVYIRLKREARGGGVSQTRKYYHLVYNGFQMDSRKISGSSRNIEELRRLGQQLAETLNINYFDESNSSEHHVTLEYTFGFNPKTTHIHALGKDRVFYASAHTAVLQNYKNKEQLLLQGHTNAIVATAMSSDRRWLVTADAGPDALVIVWDAQNGVPIRTYYSPHNEAGVCSLDISADAKFIATLGADVPQTLCLWEWVTDVEKPTSTLLLEGNDPQICIKFNPQDSDELLTNGYESVSFYARKTTGLVRTEALWERTGRYAELHLTVSHFFPNTTSALSGTTEGDLILWDCFNIGNISIKAADKTHKSAVKFLHHMHTTAINVIEPMAGKYLATGADDGYVRIFDNEFRIVYALEKIKAGPIASLTVVPGTGHDMVPSLKVPSIIVSTKIGKVVHIVRSSSTSPPISLLIMETHHDAARAMVVYPVQPLVATASVTGMVHVWDYRRRVMSAKRTFGEPLSACAVDLHERYLALGSATGNVRMVAAVDLQDASVLFDLSQVEITHMAFAVDGDCLACSDAVHAVALFRLLGGTWQLVAKIKSHSRPIRFLSFHGGDLMSAGEDRTLVVYDLALSNASSGMQIKSIRRFEQTATPKGLALLPSHVPGTGSVIVASNTEFKLKEFNSETQVCRKTVLGPTFGSHIEQLVHLPVHRVLPTTPDSDAPIIEKHDYLLFGCADKVVGLVKMPLDGNPYRTMGLIAHPEEVTSIAVSPDGKYLFTLGGCDCTVKLWQINSAVLDAQLELGGPGMEPYLKLLYDGDDYNDVYREMENIFYYAQLKSQGEDIMTERKLSNEVDIAQIPSILRAFGYYPTEEEIANIMNEIKISELVQVAPDTRTITFNDLLKIFINHRPLFPITYTELSHALQIAAGDEDAQTSVSARPKSRSPAQAISVEALVRFLQSYGEPMTKAQVDAFWTHFGHGRNKTGSMTVESFIRDVVGLEAVGHEPQ
ncbi:hypothetical protein RI367_005464 [Sorochytrium milnesiophthora]